MSSHFKRVCRVCATLIAQCRCPALDKRLEYGLCETCAAKESKERPS